MKRFVSAVMVLVLALGAFCVTGFAGGEPTEVFPELKTGRVTDTIVVCADKLRLNEQNGSGFSGFFTDMAATAGESVLGILAVPVSPFFTLFGVGTVGLAFFMGALGML